MRATPMKTAAITILAAAFALTGCASTTSTEEEEGESQPPPAIETDSTDPKLGTSLTGTWIICPSGTWYTYHWGRWACWPL